jgi:hypothetical protein
MTHGERLPLAERKALLAARAEFDRARVALALHEVRTAVALPIGPARRARARPVAKVLVRLFGPLLGRARFGRWLRAASLALVAYRIVRNWRGIPR